MKNSKDILSNLYRASLRASLVLLAVCSQAALGQEEPLAGGGTASPAEDKEKIAAYEISTNGTGNAVCFRRALDPLAQLVEIPKPGSQFDMIGGSVQGMCNLDLNNSNSTWVDSDSVNTATQNFKKTLVYSIFSELDPDPLENPNYFYSILSVIANSGRSDEDRRASTNLGLKSFGGSLVELVSSFIIPSAYAQGGPIAALACRLGITQGSEKFVKWAILRRVHSLTAEKVGHVMVRTPWRTFYNKSCERINFAFFEASQKVVWTRLRIWAHQAIGRSRDTNINAGVRYIDIGESAAANGQGSGQIVTIILRNAKNAKENPL